MSQSSNDRPATAGAWATRSVWALCFIGLLSGALMLGVEEYLSRQVRDRHASLAEDQERTIVSIDALDIAVESAGDWLLSGLDSSADAPSASSSNGVQAHFVQARMAVAELGASGAGKSAILEQLAAFESDIDVWRRSRDEAQQAYEESRGLTAARLGTLQAWSLEATGRQRLKRAIELAKYRRLEGVAARDQAEAFISGYSVGMDFSGIQMELSEIKLLIQLLVDESDLDLLSDLRDNRFRPSLTRLQRLAQRADAVAAKNSEPVALAVGQLQAALFGSDPEAGPPDGGLFAAMAQQLDLEQKRQRLRQELAALRDDYADERLRMAEATGVRMSSAMGRLHAEIAATRFKTYPPIAFAVIVFLLLARSVARALRRQMSELYASNQSIAKAHGDMELTQRSIPSILISLDASQHIVAWNHHAGTAFRQPLENVLGLGLNQLAIDWDLERVERALEDCVNSKESLTLSTLSFQSPGGHRSTLDLQFSPKLGSQGELLGLLVVGIDVQERIDMENQLAQAQKLESIGQLAAGIAHEINTPTQYATDNVRFLGESCTDLLALVEDVIGKLENPTGDVVWTPGDAELFLEKCEQADFDFLVEEVPKSIDQCLSGLRSVAEIVCAMKEFSHPGSIVKEPVHLNHSIENSVAVARNEWKYLAELELELDAGLPPVPCLQGEFNQVILNLIVNAAHAIENGQDPEKPEKGIIRIETSSSDDWVDVILSDNGCGMTEDVAARIFDPFFTTKEVGRGTGQGLAIAHSVIVDKHQGSIRVESKPGEGSTFFIRLPLDPVELDSGMAKAA